MAKDIRKHDEFFRFSMANHKVIREFLENHLPANIKEKINLSTIKQEKESFIDDKLKEQITDILYSVNFDKQSGYIYFLIEHQTKLDRLIA